MVNTVGSYETKYWHRKWIPIKNSLSISEEQRSVIIGSLLGDGTMRVGKGARNANFKVEHGVEQKEYVEWKYRILAPLVFTVPKLSYRYTEDRKKYPKSWWFRTIRHPMFTKIYHRFYVKDGYRNGRKIIPASIYQELDPMALAIWIMDDGSYQKGRMDMSTYSFSIEDINLLRKCIERKFHVAMNFFNDRGKGYRMYANKKESERLIQIIRPYVISCFKYKIGLITP